MKSWLFVLIVTTVLLTGCTKEEEGAVEYLGGVDASEFVLVDSAGNYLYNNENSYVAIDILEANMWAERKTGFNIGMIYTHTEAEEYCSSLTLAGKDDWRLPTQIELSGLLTFALDSNLIGELTYAVQDRIYYKAWSSDVSDGIQYGYTTIIVVEGRTDYGSIWQSSNGNYNKMKAICVRDK